MLAKRKYMCLGGGQKRRRRGRSLGGQGVGIEKICESGSCEEQDTPPLKGGGSPAPHKLPPEIAI